MKIIRNDKEISYANLNSKEKQMFLQKCHNLTMTLRFSGNNEENIDFYIKTPRIIQVNIEGQKLKYYNNLYVNRYATEEEKIKYQKYCNTLKACYDIALQSKENPTKRQELSIKLGLNYSSHKIIRMAYKYCYIIKHMNLEQSEKKLKVNNKYDDILRKLTKMPLDSEKDIAAFLQRISKKDQQILEGLSQRISNFIILEYAALSVEEKREKQKELKNKIRLHTDKTNKKNKEKRKLEYVQKKEQEDKKLLPIAKKTVEDYMNSNMSIEQFIKSISISRTLFLNYISIIKKYDSNSYEIYINRQNRKQEQCFNENIEIVQQVLFFIKHGLPLDGNERKTFDLIDYYLYFGINIDDIQKCIRYNGSTLTHQDYKLLRRFFPEDNKSMTPLNVEQALNSIIEYNAQRDERNFPIPGTGKIITIEEKQDVMHFLLVNNIPLTDKTYDIALKRYVKGTLYKIENSKVEATTPQLIKKASFM